MGLLFKLYLSPPTGTVYGCTACHTHLSTHDLIASKQFQGQHGRAYLFHKVVNVCEGPAQDRTMTTGLHTVRDIKCIHCDRIVGWKYEKAFEDTQKYKEGKFILEKALLAELP